MANLIKYCCFSFFFLSLSLNLFSQGKTQPHFRNYCTEHGLPSLEVYCVFEDSHGYMWFGTDNGHGFCNPSNGQAQSRHKSVCMSISRKRLELLGDNPDHSVQIQSTPKQGTRVDIHIHLQKQKAYA